MKVHDERALVRSAKQMIRSMPTSARPRSGTWQVERRNLGRAHGVSVPVDLMKQVRAYLTEHPEVPVAVAVIAGWTGQLRDGSFALLAARPASRPGRTFCLFRSSCVSLSVEPHQV
jgi:hypothetical protein